MIELQNVMTQLQPRVLGWVASKIFDVTQAAAGNGVTDDTSALQGLVAAANDGDALYFPPNAIFKIYDELPIVKSLRCFGGGKIIQAGTEKRIFNITSPDAVIDSLWLNNANGITDWGGGRGTPVMTNARGVSLTGANRAKIIDCIFENWGCAGVDLVSGANVQIKDNHFIGPAGLPVNGNLNFGVYSGVSGATTAGLQIHGNHFSNLAQGIFTGYNWYNLSIVANDFQDIIGQHAIYCDNCSNLMIAKNTIARVGQCGIKVQQANNGGGVNTDSYNVNILGNTIDTCGQVGIIVIPGEYGITKYFKGVLISDNTIVSAATMGMLIDQCQDYVIKGNTVRLAGTLGIRMGIHLVDPNNGSNTQDSKLQNGRLTENTIISSVNSAIYARLDSSSYTCHVDGNVIIDPSTAGGAASDTNSGIYLSIGTWIVRDNAIIPGTAAYGYNLNTHASAETYLIDNLFPVIKPSNIGKAPIYQREILARDIYPNLTLGNGVNSDITVSSNDMKIVGPTGAFTVGGIVGGVDGRRVMLLNTTSQTMTITREDGSSTAANRIATRTLASVVLSAAYSYAILEYDGSASRWVLIGTN